MSVLPVKIKALRNCRHAPRVRACGHQRRGRQIGPTLEKNATLGQRVAITRERGQFLTGVLVWSLILLQHRAKVAFANRLDRFYGDQVFFEKWSAGWLCFGVGSLQRFGQFVKAVHRLVVSLSNPLVLLGVKLRKNLAKVGGLLLAGHDSGFFVGRNVVRV